MTDPSPITVQATRDLLNSCYCEAAKSFGLISPEQQARALEVQARFLALDGKVAGVTAAMLADDAKWLEIAEHIKLDPQLLPVAREQVHGGKGVPKTIPSTGTISEELNYLTKENKNAILAAQAAERILRATERSHNREAQAPISEEAFVATVTAPKWAHMSKPTDPLYLQSAQMAQFKAEILEASIARAPEMLKDGEVNLALQQALTSLQGIATTSTYNAVNVLGVNGHKTTADRIAAVGEAVANEKMIESPFNFELTQSRMRVVDQGVVAAINYLAQHEKLSPATMQALSSPVQQQQASMTR